AAKPGVRMVESPAFRVTVISMNTQKGPLKDVRLRKALQAAFDYDGMVQVYKGYAEVPNSPLPKGLTQAYEASLPPFKRDLGQALQLLLVREPGRGPPARRRGPDVRRREADGALPRGRPEAHRGRALDLGRLPAAHRGDARRGPGLHLQPAQLQRDLPLLPDL